MERRALVSFDELERAVEERGIKQPKLTHWYRAQAHLLVGDSQSALKSLSEVEREDARHRAESKSLIREIGELSYALKCGLLRSRTTTLAVAKPNEPVTKPAVHFKIRFRSSQVW